MQKLYEAVYIETYTIKFVLKELIFIRVKRHCTNTKNTKNRTGCPRQLVNRLCTVVITQYTEKT